MSKRIEESSKTQSNLRGIIPYIDPKKFNELESQSYSLNEKSDVYSIGVLLWEISSGQQPFKGKSDFSLIVQIPRGLRETPVPDTPEDYVKVYIGKYDFKTQLSRLIKFIQSLCIFFFIRMLEH